MTAPASTGFWSNRPVFVIAEAGSNWRMGTPRRDMEMATALIDVAAEAGADAVKFQTFRPETIYAPNAGTCDSLAENGTDQSMDALFADLAMPYEMLAPLAAYATDRGLAFMSTPFSPADFAAVDPLVEVHKIASYEVTHIRLIELAARSGKPTLMSTGAATLEDIAWAVEHFHANGGRDLCLLQCTAKYPAPLDAINLRAIPTLADTFGVPAGLSDHSREAIIAPVGATALGAAAIEKHYTIDNRLPGPDHSFAITPSELNDLVAAVRQTEAARGDGVKQPHAAEDELLGFAQRAVQALTPIAAGDVFTEDANIAILRAGKQPKGVHPRRLAEIDGARATRALAAGEGVKDGDWEV